MLSSAVAAQTLRDLVDVVSIKPDGTPWTPQGVHNLHRSMCKMLADAVSRNAGSVSFAELLTAETIAAYCDGATLGLGAALGTALRRPPRALS